MGFAHAGLLSAPRTYAIPNSKAVQKENASSFSQSNECGKDTFHIEYIRKEMSDFLSGYMLSDYRPPTTPSPPRTASPAREFAAEAGSLTTVHFACFSDEALRANTALGVAGAASLGDPS